MRPRRLTAWPGGTFGAVSSGAPAPPPEPPPGLDYPESLADVVLWLDARQPKFTDLAGTTPAGYSAPVRRLNLRVPAGQYASAASDAARPVEENGALSFRPAHMMTVPATGPVTLNNLSFGLSYSARDCGYGATIFKVALAQILGYYVFNATVSGGRTAGVDIAGDGISGPLLGSPPDYHQIPPCTPVAAVVRISTTALKVSVSINGVREDFSIAHVNEALPFFGPWQIGGDGGASAMKHSVLVARAISDGETTALLAWLVANPAPLKFPTDLDFVGISGDSIARSLGVTNRLDWWTTLMQTSLCATRNINMYSIAQSGDTIGFQQAPYASVIKPIYSASRTKNIMLNPIGINNMAGGGGSGAATWALYSTYLDTQLVDGFLPIACTVLPTTAAPGATTDAFNALVRANWASKGYAALADVAAVPGLQDPNNLAIYPDNLHPSAAGNALMAPVYAAAVALVRG